MTPQDQAGVNFALIVEAHRTPHHRSQRSDWMRVSSNTSDAPITVRGAGRIAFRVAALIATCFLLDGCGHWFGKPVPQLTFTNVPPVYDGGLDVMMNLSGKVSGAESGQHVVLYAKSEGRWWIQPTLQSTGDPPAEWQGQTHPGTEYGALLVDGGFAPPLNTEVLPAVGGQIAAVAAVPGTGSQHASTSPQVLHFSGYDWTVRSEPSHRGGSRNEFDPGNAWVDPKGALHLKISRKGDHWTSSEVKLTRSLGYGTYSFVVRDTSQMDLSAVLTLFTWDGGGPEENRREVSYEISHWGNPEDKPNTTMLIQPYYIATNGVRFQAPTGAVTDSYRWDPSQVAFTSYAGIHTGGEGGHLLKQKVFTSGIPAAGGESVRINLYVFGKGQVPLQHENEIVIDRFEFFP